MNKEINERKYSMNRRAFLAKSAIGIGSAALVSMFGCTGENKEAADMMRKIGGAIGNMDFAPKAKRVIYLFQSGGPSQLEWIAAARSSKYWLLAELRTRQYE